MKQRDPDYYRKIGARGGAAKHPNKGFGSMTPEDRTKMGRQGAEARIRNFKERHGEI